MSELAITEEITIPRDELGESLHTGLRKGCDSPTTGLLHTAIDILNYEVWDWFLDILHHNFEKSGVSAETIKYVFSEYGDMSIWSMHDKLGTEREYRDWIEEHRSVENHHQHISVFTYAVNMMTHDDIESLMCWFRYCHAPQDSAANV